MTKKHQEEFKESTTPIIQTTVNPQTNSLSTNTTTPSEPVVEELPAMSYSAANEYALASRTLQFLRDKRSDLINDLTATDNALRQAEARTNKAREALLKCIERDCK